MRRAIVVVSTVVSALVAAPAGAGKTYTVHPSQLVDGPLSLSAFSVYKYEHKGIRAIHPALALQGSLAKAYLIDCVIADADLKKFSVIETAITATGSTEAYQVVNADNAKHLKFAVTTQPATKRYVYEIYNEDKSINWSTPYTLLSCNATEMQ